MLIFLEIELLVIEPAELDGVVESPQAVQELNIEKSTVHL